MRLWSIHPKYLDAKGLTALWREALLAKAVLEGKSKGYANHPQPLRFISKKDPVGMLNLYLHFIHKEAMGRGYSFDGRKIGRKSKGRIAVSRGQIEYEFAHLKAKLARRDKRKLAELSRVNKIEPHPIFIVRNGPVEKWEKVRPIYKRI
ncbi:MAG: pyrimidine dimer DNA glycosylase/endonuclease V [Candidatus Anstonellales archaeon]